MLDRKCKWGAWMWEYIRAKLNLIFGMEDLERIWKFKINNDLPYPDGDSAYVTIYHTELLWITQISAFPIYYKRQIPNHYVSNFSKIVNFMFCGSKCSICSCFSLILSWKSKDLRPHSKFAQNWAKSNGPRWIEYLKC